MQSKNKHIHLTVFRSFRDLIYTKKTRKRALGMLVFALFTTHFFLNAVTVEATTCPTSGAAVITGDCDYDPGTYSLDSLTISNGATVTVGDSASPGQVVLNISGDMDLCATCAITADELGNPYDTGTGVGTAHGSGSGGGGYGGRGGDGNEASGGAAYGSVTEPVHIGSGGGYDGGGDYYAGGAVKIIVGGTATIDGTISADGQNAYSGDSGGASGGSIWLDAGTMAGTATITAAGGNGYIRAGGGSGGRIAIYSDAGSTSGWTITAYGGAMGTSTTVGYSDGAAGTVYTKGTGATNGDLKIIASNEGRHNYTDILGAAELYDNFTLQQGALLTIPTGKKLSLDAAATFTMGGTHTPIFRVESGGEFDPQKTSLTFDNLHFEHYGTVSTVDDFTIDNATYSGYDTGTFSAGISDLTLGNSAVYRQYGTNPITYGNLTLLSGGLFTHGDNSSSKANVVSISAANVDIKSGSEINVDYLGYDGGQGPGVGTVDYGGGGGHGGKGGDYTNYGHLGGPTNDSATEPSDLGSGAQKVTSDDRGSGGGAVKIVATGTITVDGTITADGRVGASSVSAGGAGGSVWLDAGTIDGTGAITAEGGPAASASGGGGGGRVAVHYTNESGDLDIAYVVQGGDGGSNIDKYDGGGGTLYMFDKNADTYGRLIVDGGDRYYVNYSDMSDDDALGSPKAPTYDDITVRNGAKYRVPSAYTLTLDTGGTFTGGGTAQSMLSVASGGTFVPTGATSFTFNNVDFEHDGAINVVTNLTMQDGSCDYNTATATYGVGTPNSLTLESGGELSTRGTGSYSATTVLAKDGSNMTHADNSDTKANILSVSATDITIGPASSSTATITVDFLGYDGGEGPGVGSIGYGGAGGYGGRGGNYDANGTMHYGGDTNGSVTEPDSLGSGAWRVTTDDRGSGGGSVKLEAINNLILNGTISSDGRVGAASVSAGGSGGSVWLDAGTISGDGTIAVEGGPAASASGGGGGGRIAVYHTNGDPLGLTYVTKGGAGGSTYTLRYDGGAGTAYIFDKDDDTYGDLIVDGGDHDDINYSDTADDDALGSPKIQTYDNITIRNGAEYRVTDGYSLILAAAGTLTGGSSEQGILNIGTGGAFTPTGYTSWTFNNIDVDHDGTLNVVTNLTLQNSTYHIDPGVATFGAGDLATVTHETGGIISTEGTGDSLTLGTVTVKSGGGYVHADNSETQEHVIDLAVTNIDFQGSSFINADWMGFDSGTGPGVGGGTASGGGGGHAGIGGEGESGSGGSSYGSITQPDDFGSGSGCDKPSDYWWYTGGLMHRGSGGGAAKIVASGTMNVDGTLSADGYVGTISTCSGGSGGSLWLDAGTFTGGGTVSVQGGHGQPNGGGGSGGRIAILHTNGSTGSLTYDAGGGYSGWTAGDYSDGAGGTIYLYDRDADTNGNLVVDGDENDASNFTVLSGTLTFDDIDVDAGAITRIATGATLNMNTGGQIDGSGSEQGELHIQSGATLNPSATTLVVNDIDVYHSGNMSGVATMTMTNGAYNFDGTFDSGLTTLTVGSGATFTHSSNSDLFSGSDLIVDGGTFVQDNLDVIGVTNVQVINGGKITHTDNAGSEDAKVYISASGDFTIDGTSSIDVNYLGFDETTGTGAGDDDATSAGGAGYGGAGGNGSGAAQGGIVYGSATAPTDHGSGGGTDTTSGSYVGGSGGGAIRLVVTGTLDVSGSGRVRFDSG